MADEKKLKDEELKDVNGGGAIFNAGQETVDKAVWFGGADAPTEIQQDVTKN